MIDHLSTDRERFAIGEEDMATDHGYDQGVAWWEAEQVEAAAREAAAIGGHAGDEQLDPAQRPLVEGGEGVSEGFELAEEDLIEAAQHGDDMVGAPSEFTREAGRAPVGVYGEADHEDSSEIRDGDR
jgi:hypothetical protein